MRKARAGRTTIKRGILLNTLSRTPSGQRPGLLEQALRFLRQLVADGGIKGVLYKKREAINGIPAERLNPYRFAITQEQRAALDRQIQADARRILGHSLIRVVTQLRLASG